MKKKNLKNFSLNKKSISKLDNSIQGGKVNYQSEATNCLSPAACENHTVSCGTCYHTHCGPGHCAD